MKSKIIYIGLLLILPIIGFFPSCTKKKLEPLVCFQEDILPIFNSSCGNVGCHNEIDRKEGIVLTNYDDIMRGIVPGHPKRSEYFEVIKDHEMPPENYAQLSDEQIEKIKHWIDLGAMNSSNCSSGNCDTNTFTYSAGVQPILSTNCTGCHNSTNTAIGDFTNFTMVQAMALDGSIIGSILQDGTFSPMPKNQSKLSDCNIRVIQKWINAGAPNN
jgi:ribosomal protein S16